MRIFKSIRFAGFLVILTSSQVAAQFLGAVIDEAAFLATPKAPPLSRGDYGTLPSKASLKSFAPQPGDQGQQGSCVGWATAYAARTILASSNGEVPERKASFSPAYVYNQIHVGGCNDGSLLSDALRLLAGDGAATLADFPYDEHNCTRLPNTSQMQRARTFRIGEWRRLFDSFSVNKHIPVRRALAEGHPVPIAMMLPKSFMDYSNGIFRATTAEREAIISGEPSAIDRHIAGGHAMTAIGYDDDGQWIEIINSWSHDWGEDGYVRVSWETFNTFVVEAYEIMPQLIPEPEPEPEPIPDFEPEPAPDPEPSPSFRDISASLRFFDLIGNQITAYSEANGWILSRPLPSGASFRVEATPGESASIYVLGAGSDGQFVELFPRSELTSTRVGADDTLLLPGPTEDHFTQLDQSTGKDVYLVLIASLNLDLVPVIATLEQTTGQPLQERLRAALGKRLVNLADIDHANDKISFKAEALTGDVVAIPVYINHIAPAQDRTDKDAPRIVLTNPSRETFDAAANTPFVVTSRTVTIAGRAQDDSQIASVAIDGALSMRHSNRGPFQAQITLPPGDGPHSITIEASDVAGNSTSQTLWFQLRN
jgi:hypothetical protein